MAQRRFPSGMKPTWAGILFFAIDQRLAGRAALERRIGLEPRPADLAAAVDAGAVAAVGDARERDLDVLQFLAFAARGLVAHLLQQLPALRLEQRAEFIGMEVGHGGSFLPSRKC